MRVIGLDVSKQTGWVIASEEGEILEAGVLTESDDAEDSIATEKDEVA